MLAPEVILLARARRNNDDSPTMSPEVKHKRYKDLFDHATKNKLTMLAAYYKSLMDDAKRKLNNDKIEYN